MRRSRGHIDRLVGASKKQISRRTGIKVSELKKIEKELPPDEFMSKLRIRVLEPGYNDSRYRRLLAVFNKYNFKVSKDERSFVNMLSGKNKRKYVPPQSIVERFLRLKREALSGKLTRDTIPMNGKVYILEHENLGPLGVLNVDHPTVKLDESRGEEFKVPTGLSISNVQSISTNRPLIRMLEETMSKEIGRKVRLPVATILKTKLFSDYDVVVGSLSPDGVKLNKHIKRLGANLKFLDYGVGLHQYLYVSKRINIPKDKKPYNKKGPAQKLRK